MKTYIKPRTDIVNLSSEHVIAASVRVSNDRNGQAWTREKGDNKGGSNSTLWSDMN